MKRLPDNGYRDSDLTKKRLILKKEKRNQQIGKKRHGED
jgi:hypothetical protein